MKMWNMLETVREIWRDGKGPQSDEVRIAARNTLWWMLAVELVVVAEPYPIKLVFDALTAGQSVWKLASYVALIGAANYLAAFADMKMSRHRNNFAWSFWAWLGGYGHYRELKMDVKWHVQHSTGEKESIMQKSISKAEGLMDELLFNTAPSLVRIVFTTVCAFLLAWQFGAIASATVVVFGFSVRSIERSMSPLRKESRKEMKRIEHFGTQLTQNWRTIKLLGIEDRQVAEHKTALSRYSVTWKRNFYFYTKALFAQDSIITISRIFMYGFIVMHFSAVSQIGSFILATAWMERIYNNLNRFSTLQRRLNDGGEAVRDLSQMLTTPPEVAQSAQPRWSEKLQGAIAFDRVSFRYENTDKDALANVNLEIRPNQCVALVGFSGSGKSTFASLLLREYDPLAGVIKIDGIHLRDLDYDRYRREMIACVSQRVELFDEPIIDNIRKGSPDATSEEVMRAATEADAHQFIMEMPKGYDSVIGEDGIFLSGGQRQLVAIARALIRKPRILVLDEATSSLDAVSQREVQNAIDRLIRSRSCTIVIIAHRFSTIMQADMVVVLDKGEIVEIGTHGELEQRDGLYKRLRDLEMAGILKEG